VRVRALLMQTFVLYMSSSLILVRAADFAKGEAGTEMYVIREGLVTVTFEDTEADSQDALEYATEECMPAALRNSLSVKRLARPSHESACVNCHICMYLWPTT
jgi:hypothetical protein